MKTLQFSIREITFHLIPEYVTDETRHIDALYFFTQLNNLCDQFHHFFLTLQSGMESIYIFRD